MEIGFTSLSRSDSGGVSGSSAKVGIGLLRLAGVLAESSSDCYSNRTERIQLHQILRIGILRFQLQRSAGPEKSRAAAPSRASIQRRRAVDFGSRKQPSRSPVTGSSPM